MGQEADCSVRWNGVEGSGRALLEGDHLIFRGEFRIDLPFREIVEARAVNGHLTVRTPSTELSLELGGNRADRWLRLIRNPKSLLEKLEIKPGQRIAVIGDYSDEFLKQLAERIPEYDVTLDHAPYDRILFRMDTPKELSQLASLRGRLAVGGALWIVIRKGKEGRLTEGELFEAAKAAGLANTKVAAVSETRTGHKLMIRRSHPT